MTIKEFNKLTVNNLVYFSIKGRGVPTAGGCAYKINRTTKQIKPFGSNKWYSYKLLSRTPVTGISSSSLWGICGPTYILEMQATDQDLTK